MNDRATQTSKPCRLFLAAVLLCLAAPLHAKTLSAGSCADNDVQSAISAAVTGDTVLVPAGTCTWNTQVTIPANKGITLQGAGIGVTVINDGLPSNHTLLILADSSPVVTRVTQFTFNSNGTTKSGELALVSVNNNTQGGGGVNRFRIDHNKFDSLRTRGILVWMRGQDLGGVIDSNSFNVPGTGTVQAMAIEGTGPQDGTPFTRPFTPGTAHAIYIEDNIFNFPNGPNDGALDAYTGARYVFRHNTVYNTIIGHHGADSGTGRGLASCEIYQNTQIANAGFSVSRIHFWRSCTGVDFGNTVISSGGGSFSERIVLTNYRDNGSYAPWGKCDGTSAWDQNLAGQDGYSCLDQVGHFFTANSGGANTLYPLYVWGNTLNGAQLDASSIAKHIQENRDFYNQKSNFDGTVGVGVGLLANRPATCAGKTAYFASDTTTLYQCGGNGWSPYYKPYAYPHPLRASGSTPAPAPPTNLQGQVI